MHDDCRTVPDTKLFFPRPRARRSIRLATWLAALSILAFGGTSAEGHPPAREGAGRTTGPDIDDRFDPGARDSSSPAPRDVPASRGLAPGGREAQGNENPETSGAEDPPRGENATDNSRFDVPAGDLASALDRFSEQAGLALDDSAASTSGLRTRGVQGDFSTDEALDRLLAGTDLEYRIEGGETLVLVSPSRKETVIVSATRIETPVSDATRSVTVVEGERIEQQATVNPDIGDILAKEVPGLGLSTEGLTNFTQNLRGRSFLVMVHGVPISTPLMSSGRDLKIIDSAALERIEVVRGGTAVYGFGATGGLINFIPLDSRGKDLTGSLSFDIGSSTEEIDDSLRWQTTFGASGQTGPFDLVVNGSIAQRDGFFDADGDRIPPDPLGGQGGLADTREWNVLAKIGRDFDSGRQRLELLFNDYDIEQDTAFVTNPGNVTTGEKATAVPGQPIGNQGRTENRVISLRYEHRDFFDNYVALQVYRIDYTASFPIVEFATGLPAPDDTDNAGSINQFDKNGARLTVDTPLWADTLSAHLTWGLDYLREESSELVVGDNAVFGVPSLPGIEQDSLAGYLQFSLPIREIGQIRAGLRHEEITLDVPTFSGPGGFFGPGGTVTGGELSYDETLLNLTAVFDLTHALQVFGGFSQGFSVSDVRSVLRAPAFSGGGGGNAEALNPEAQEVDNYELGFRGASRTMRGSFVGFFTASELGVTFSNFAQVSRQPEDIWGLEASVEVDIHPEWTVGGTGTWLDSRTDLDGDGDLDEELPTRRLPPAKITAFVEYTPTNRWSHRVQALHSGTRDPDGATNFAGAPDEIDESFLIVDYLTAFELGSGRLRLGINNLFNEDYFPVSAQSFGLASALSKGRGRSLSLGYDIDW
jgi:iron complex outermembrane receptor protein